MHFTKNIDSDSESIDSIESVNFFKSVLSFMDEENFDEDSGFSSFNKEMCGTSGNWSSFSSDHFSEPSYKTSNHFNKLALTWSPVSSGSTLSAKENVSVHSDPIKTPPKEFWGLINLNTQAERASKSVTQKNLLFIKYLKTGLLPDIQNHPARKSNKDFYSFSNTQARDFPNFRPQKEQGRKVTKDESKTMNFMTSTPKKNVSSEDKKQKITKNLNEISRNFNVKQLEQIIESENTDLEIDTADQKVCKFCLKNGEPQLVYLGHTVKDFDGLVTCPILQRHTCEICGAAGEYSHTRKYCPKNKESRHLYLQPTYKRLTNGVLTNDFVYYKV